jgi:hypothetical protein
VIENLKVYHMMAWPLFPCHSSGAKAKAPLTTHGFKDASLDWQQIEAWYQQFPGCAWGVATSAKRAVLDVDVNKGGSESLARLIAERGALPATPKVITGSGGYHYWLRCPAGTPCGKPFPGIDRKAEGGYVIVPPSRIAIPEHEGRAYTWAVRPWEIAIAEAPTWFLGLKQMPKASAEATAEADDPWVVQEASADLLSHPGSPEGERRKTLCQLVGVHLARGDSNGSIKAMAEAWASRCSPPLGEWEKHVLGILRREALKLTTIPSPLPSAGLSVSLEHGKEGNNSQPEAHAQAEFFFSFPPSANGETESGEARERLSAETLTAEASAAQVEAKGSSPGSVADAYLPGTSLEPDSMAASAKAEAFARGQGLEPTASAEPQADWPSLSAEAYHGLLGEMLKAISPQTEADPSGILLGWLTCFGNIVGRGAWVTVGPRLHHPALYVGIVGKTSDAKGDSWAASLWPFKQLEPAWASSCIAHGVGSGEGLLDRIADAQTVIDKKGNAQVIPGAPDKRCLLRLSELSQCFKKGRRENSTLSEYLREGWDGEPIHLPNRKGNALSASDYAVSVYGDVTPGVLRKTLETGTEGFDGFANRFLWAAVKRSRFLPSGGSMESLKPYLGRLQPALAFAKQAGELKRDADAEALWNEVYPSLATSGDDVPHTDRARPYALRLAMLYALADESKVIRAEHLRAALAVWAYCRQSARLIFGERHGPTPDEPLWLRLLNAIGKVPGIRRSELLRTFRSVSADELDGLLAGLEAKGLAHRRMVSPDGGGRPAECWYPGPKPDGQGQEHGRDGESQVNDNHSPLSAVQPASPWVVQADSEPKANAESVGKEGNNSGQEAEAEAESLSVGKERKEGNNSSAEAESQGGSYFLPSHASGAEAESQGGSYFLPSHASGESEGPKGQSQAPELIPSFPSAEPKGESETAQPQARGESEVTLPEFKAECIAAVGPWDAPKPYRKWRSEAEQLRWYMVVKKAEQERQRREQERWANEMPEAEFMAELQNML